MKGLIAFSIIIIFVNCQYCVRNESMTLTLNSESHYIQERLFHNDVIEDSLESFIKDVGPDSYSNTVYTIDFAKYKSDTLISFMAYKHVLLDSTYFFVDSRALHRGQDNNYLLGTSHHKDSVDDYTVLAGDDNAPLPISSVHSHPNTLDVLTMGYHNDTYYGSDQWKVNNNQASLYNYVYFPKSTSLYLAGKYNPIYIKHIRSYNNFYFGTLNHK